jgi:peroxiredoxin
MNDVLHPGDAFPALTLTTVGGEELFLPDALRGHFAVVLFNRGSWCPYCRGQLRAFQRAQETLDGLGVKVVSLSVDDEPTTRAMVDKLKLTFPVGHSSDARAVAAATGSPPVSSSTRTAGSSWRSTPTAPSDGSCPRMSRA